MSIRIDRGAPAVPVGDLPPVALRRPAMLDRLRRLGTLPALALPALAAFDAFGRLCVHGLCDRRAAALRGQALDHDAAQQRTVPQIEPVADAQLARCLGGLSVDVDAALR